MEVGLARALAAIALASAALAPVAQGDALHGAFMATGSAELAGAMAWRGDVSAAALTGTGPWTLTIEDGSARLVNVPWQRLALQPPMLRGAESTSTMADEDGPALALPANASLTFMPSAGAGALLQPLGAGFLDVSAQTPDGLAFAPVAAAWSPPGPTFEKVTRIGLDGTAPAGAYAIADGSVASLRVGGPLRLALAGGTASVAGRTYSTGTWLNSSRSVSDPATGSGRQVYDDWILVVEAREVRVSCVGCSAQVAYEHLQGMLDGSFTWRGVQGQASIDGRDLDPRPDALQVEGALDWTARADASGTSWGVRGAATSVAVDLASVWETGSAAAAVSVVAILALAGSRVMGALGSAAGLFTRLVRSDVSGHSARRRILQCIHASQPATLAQLQAGTGLSRGALRYHLRVLSAHDILHSEVPHGHERRNRAYMLNSGSLLFDARGTASPAGIVNPGRTLPTVRSSPIRQAILDRLLAAGPATYEQLRDHLLASGVVAAWPPSSASHHLSKMVASGTLACTRDGAVKRYAANLDPAQATRTQHQRLLDDLGSFEVVQAIARGPEHGLPVHEVRAAWAADEAPSRLRALCDLAILQHDGARGTYRLDPSIRRALR